MNKQNVLVDFEDFLNSYEVRGYGKKHKHKFPICSDDPLLEEYAYLVGKVIGDGNLDPNFTLRFVGREDDLILLKKLIFEKFQIPLSKMTIRRKVSRGVSYLLQVNCSYFGRILFLLGAPVGNKTLIPFEIPSWISFTNVSKRRFLQAILEDELTTIKIERCSYSVNLILKMAKNGEFLSDLSLFLSQVKKILESFGIECGRVSSKPIINEKTKELYFHIHRNKRNILRFKDKIGFRLNQHKISNLDECCLKIQESLSRKL